MRHSTARLCGAIAFAALAIAPESATAFQSCEPPSLPYEPVSEDSAAQTVSSSSIYLDVSGSMGGFVTPPQPNDAKRFAGEVAIYPDIVRGLPAILAEHGAPVEARVFGSAIGARSDLKQLDTAASPSTYGRVAKGGLGGKSQIDLVLNQIAEAPNTSLAVIATDLFLTQDKLYGSLQAQLTSPMAKILHSGRSIGLLAVRSKYTKDVDDLPTARPYRGAVARPVYFLIIGPDKAVTKTRTALDAAYLQASNIKKNFALFSSRWGQNTADLSKELKALGMLRQGRFLPPGTLHIPQYELPSLPQTWSVRVPKQIDTSGRIKITTSMQAWLYPADSDSCTWAPPVNANNLVRDDGDTLTASIGQGHILAGRSYLLRGALIAAALDETAEPFMWMREWSFDTNSEAATIARRPQMFPTLNLLGLGQTLAKVAMNDLLKRNSALASFEIAVRIR